MNLKFQNKELDQLVKKYQEGGEMPPAEGTQPAPAPEQGGGDPMEQIIVAAAEAVRTQDAQLALQVCQALVQIAGSGAEAAPPTSQPVYKAGGKLSRWISK